MIPSSNTSSPPRKRESLESFTGYQPHIIKPSDISWLAVLFILVGRWGEYEPAFVYRCLQALLRESFDVKPKPWLELLKEICSDNDAKSKDGKNLNMHYYLTRLATTLKDPNQLHKFISEDIPKLLKLTTNGMAYAEGTQGLHRKSLLALHLRRIRLAYRKLSEAATHRLVRGFVSWIDKNDPGNFERAVVKMHGYDILPTSASSCFSTDSYEAFKYSLHTGSLSIALDHLRQFFDQRFNEGRQPPRQHMLNAMLWALLEAENVQGGMEIANEAIDIARTVGDRTALMNVMSHIRRLPPLRTSHLLKEKHGVPYGPLLVAKEIHKQSGNGVTSEKTVLQVGTEPRDLLWDVRASISEGQPLSSLFRTLHSATGVLDIHPLPTPTTPIPKPIPSLRTQWEILAVASSLYRLAGQSIIASHLDRIVLKHLDTETARDDPGMAELRLYVQCCQAREEFKRGEYVKAIGRLMDVEVWGNLGMRLYGYWIKEVWELIWDIANRRGQERLKRDFLVPRKPKENTFDETVQEGKKSPKRIRKLILDAAEALRAKNPTLATFSIIDALHYSESNGFWLLYRAAIPIFAELELRRGKIESAQRCLEEVLWQLVRGDDLEVRGMGWVVWSRVLIKRGELEEALGYLKKAEEDFTNLEMYSSMQDCLYLQAVIYGELGMVEERDQASSRCREIEGVERRMETGLDESLMSIWEVAEMIGVSVASGDTYV